jgi:hypothetical protein
VLPNDRMQVIAVAPGIERHETAHDQHAQRALQDALLTAGLSGGHGTPKHRQVTRQRRGAARERPERDLHDVVVLPVLHPGRHADPAGGADVAGLRRAAQHARQQP